MTDGHTGPPASPVTPAGERFDGWKEIAVYLGRDPRTVQRWEKKEGLPVHRHQHDKGGTVYAFKKEVDEWWASRRAALEAEPAGNGDDAGEVATEIPVEPPRAGAMDAQPGPSRRDKLILAAVIIAIVLVAGYFLREYFKSQVVRRDAKTRIAVLPFENLSGNAEHDYIASGVSEEMTTALSRLNPAQLGVLAWTTMKTYKGSGKSVQDIAREVNADYVLEGSVRITAQQVRVTAQLILAKDQTHVWSEVYDSQERDVGDIIAIQSEVANRVARDLAVELLPDAQRRLASPQPVNREAYLAYLRGRALLDTRNIADMLAGIQAFQRSIQLEPENALAYAGLADVYGGMAFYGVMPPRTAYPKAIAAAQRALEIDPTLAEAHTSLADWKYLYEYDWEAASSGFQRAIALNPNYATAHHWYGVHLSLRGGSQQAEEEIRLARALDPLSLVIGVDQALHDFYLGRYDQAIEHCRAVLRRDPNFVLAHFWMARALAEKKMHAEAIATFQKAIDLQPGNALALALQANTYAASGETAKARRILATLEPRARDGEVAASLISVIYAGLGETEQAVRWAEKAYEAREPLLTRAKVDPVTRPLRAHPRYQELLKKIGPPEELPAR